LTTVTLSRGQGDRGERLSSNVDLVEGRPIMKRSFADQMFGMLGLLVIAVVLFVGCSKLPKDTDTPAPAVSATYAEDDPRFDCHTMGNRSCAPEPSWRAVGDAAANGARTGAVSR